MSGITLEVAKSMFEAAKTAYLSACTAQEYRVGSRSKRAADLKNLRQDMEYWDNKVKELKAVAAGKGRRRSYRITPRDL